MKQRVSANVFLVTSRGPRGAPPAGTPPAPRLTTDVLALEVGPQRAQVRGAALHLRASGKQEGLGVGGLLALLRWRLASAAANAGTAHQDPAGTRARPSCRPTLSGVVLQGHAWQPRPVPGRAPEPCIWPDLVSQPVQTSLGSTAPRGHQGRTTAWPTPLQPARWRALLTWHCRLGLRMPRSAASGGRVQEGCKDRTWQPDGSGGGGAGRLADVAHQRARLPGGPWAAAWRASGPGQHPKPALTSGGVDGKRLEAGPCGWPCSWPVRLVGWLGSPQARRGDPRHCARAASFT